MDLVTILPTHFIPYMFNFGIHAKFIHSELKENANTLCENYAELIKSESLSLEYSDFP